MFVKRIIYYFILFFFILSSCSNDNATYYLSTSITGEGSVIISPDQISYNLNDLISLTAIPNTNWYFKDWSGDVNSLSNPLEIIIDSNKSLTATFEKLNEYTLSVDIIGSGNVIINPISDTYLEGSSVELASLRETDWVFTGWSGDIENDEDTIVITMDSNMEIIATFEEIEVNVTYAGTSSANINTNYFYISLTIINLGNSPITVKDITWSIYNNSFSLLNINSILKNTFTETIINDGDYYNFEYSGYANDAPYYYGYRASCKNRL